MVSVKQGFDNQTESARLFVAQFRAQYKEVIMETLPDVQGCVDIVAVFALLLVLLLLIAYLLYRRITDGVHVGNNSPPGDAESEDILDVSLAEHDLCPTCGIGILIVEKTESNSEDATVVGTYHLRCGHCMATYPDD